MTCPVHNIALVSVNDAIWTNLYKCPQCDYARMVDKARRPVAAYRTGGEASNSQMSTSKYRNRKTVVDGLVFDSKKEARRWQELQLMEGSGRVTGLMRQVRYDFVVNGVKLGFYKADFVYYDYGELVVEDVKGMKTPVYNLKKKLMSACHGIDIIET